MIRRQIVIAESNNDRNKNEVCKVIKELIVQEYEAKQKCEKDTQLGIIISGEEYATWLMTCSQVLLNKFPNNQLAQNFFNKSQKPQLGQTPRTQYEQNLMKS